MKKKFLLSAIAAVVAVVILTSSGIISELKGNWIKVSDPQCNKCLITDEEHKCGKCGSWMNSKYENWDAKMEYMIYSFTCKNTSCSHKCTYKIKP